MLSTKRTRYLILVLAALVVLTHSLQAQVNFSRLNLTIKNEEGEIVKEARVLVTCDEIPSLRDEFKTSKKGKVVVPFVDPTRVYNILVEADGYQPISTQFRPDRQTSTSTEVVLKKPAASAPPGSEPGARLSAAEIIFNEGVQLLRQNDTAGAKVKFLEALEVDAGLAPAYSALAGIYVQEDAFQEAADAAQKYLDLEPDNPRGLRLLYEAHRGLGNKADAETARQKLAQLGGAGETAAITYNEGVAALQAGDMPQARSLFQEAIQMQPDLASAHGALGMVHLMEGSFEEALTSADSLQELDPESARAWRIRYEAHKALGNGEEERVALTRLAELDPEAVSTKIFEHGLDLFEEGQMREAADEFERVLIVVPDHAKANYQLGLTYTNLNLTDQARSHLERFIELAPDDPEAGTAREMLSFLNQ